MTSKATTLKKEELAKKVEELGVFFENFDHTPTAARIISFLLVSDPYYQDFEAIREFLQASKSTISTTLNVLFSKGIVDYLTLPGDRKRYFKVNPDKWLELTKKSLRNVTSLKEKLQEVINLRNKKNNPEFIRGLEDLNDFYVHLDKYLIKAVSDWNAKHK